ncbi:hypothetical protein ABIA38_009068 [Embleya sp. AB8]
MFVPFVPLVSVTPATVPTRGGSAASILAGAALGAAIAPPPADAAAFGLPAHIRPMVAYTATMVAYTATMAAYSATMAVCTASIVPILVLLPGFRPTWEGSPSRLSTGGRPPHRPTPGTRRDAPRLGHREPAVTHHVSAIGNPP